jgi:hypothetical protein
MQDNQSTFMTRTRERAHEKITAHDERRQVLNLRAIWDGSIDCFEVFKNNVEGCYGQSGAPNLFHPEYQTAYLERGPELFADFLDEIPFESQIKKDNRALYGALLSVCQGGVRGRILTENRLKQDGIRSWYQLVNNYEKKASVM